MINDNKLTYETPTLGVIHVEMEQGIAASSIAPDMGTGMPTNPGPQQEWDELGPESKGAPW